MQATVSDTSICSVRPFLCIADVYDSVVIIILVFLGRATSHFYINKEMQGITDIEITRHD